MIGKAPKFIDSEYFVAEPDNWHLKPGAPADVVKEFNEYMQEYEPEAFKIPTGEEQTTP